MIISENGEIVDGRVLGRIQKSIERGQMSSIVGIVVHQTGSSSADSTFHSYANASANGAHFLIDKDGTIYQTASVYRKTAHVGRLKARCLAEHRCSPAEIKSLKAFNPAAEHAKEKKKTAPDRFPSNEDAIGIELVGEALPRGNHVPDHKKVYETVTPSQNEALQWLIRNLSQTLGISAQEVFRHPDISRKNHTEASTAQW